MYDRVCLAQLFRLVLRTGEPLKDVWVQAKLNQKKFKMPELSELGEDGALLEWLPAEGYLKFVLVVADPAAQYAAGVLPSV